MKHTAGHIFLTGAILLFLASCSRQIPGPISPPINETVPPTPANLQVTVGDRTANLSWTISDSVGIAFYRVYQSDSSAAGFVLISEPQGRSFSVNNLQNDKLYYFKVSSVNFGRFEGYACQPVSALPNLYAININSGDDFTNNRNIVVNLIAPLGTQFVQLADDSTFSDANWAEFAPSKSWELPDGDGLHTVYARFRDREDNITAGFYHDSIILDTEAFIDSVLFSPVGQPFSTGQNVHFKLCSFEPDGIAGIVIGQNLALVELYDDGTHGDRVSADGTYEADFEITDDLDFENAVAMGNFTDRAGNTAPQVQSREYITVRRAPNPVSIFSIIPEMGRYDRLTLNWNASSASDFAQYRVYRADLAGVDSTASLIETITSSQTTSLTDTGLAQDETYYYKVYVLDNTGLWAGSNEVLGTTNPNNPPEAVTLFPVIAVPGTHDRLSLTWSSCDDQDFLRYELYRSLDGDVDSSDALVLASAAAVTFTDTSLAANTVYYYRVRTVDRVGNSAWSNTASGRTGLDEPPDAPTLLPLFTEPDRYEDVQLNWSQPFTSDFREFRVYNWLGDLGRSDSLLIALIVDQDSTSLLLHPSMPVGYDTVDYWYIVHVYDESGGSTASNDVRARLIDLEPETVTGAVIADSAVIVASWIPSDIPDFGVYKLLRDTLSTPGQAQTIFLSADQESNGFDDTNIVQGRTYYYWLEVYDRRDHSSRSFLGSARW